MQKNLYISAILITMLFSCKNFVEQECEKYSLRISYDKECFILEGEHSFKMIRFTDKQGFTLKEINFDSDEKLYDYKSDLEKMQLKEKMDTLYFKILSSVMSDLQQREFTGKIYKNDSISNEIVCPNIR